MPHWNWRSHPEGTTDEEFQAILELRKVTARRAAEDPTCAYPEKTEDRWGWKTTWRAIGRDQDGSLCLVVVIQGPREEIAYRSQYRLVDKKLLPWKLGKG